MPLILTEKERTKLLKKRQAKKIRGNQLRAPKKPEQELVRRMNALWQSVLFPATEHIKQLVRSNAPIAELSQAIDQALQLASAEYALKTEGIIDRWLLSLDNETRARMQQAIRQSLGVDLSIVMDQPLVKDAMDVGRLQSVNLIKTIPGEYLAKVADAIADNYSGKDLPEGRNLIEQIQHIHVVTYKRARLIARDQTSKMTGNLNRVRQQAIGVEEYVWHTVHDERVAGNPKAGKAPSPQSRTHGNHYDRDGKTFRWDDPPPDGHPGQPINCRCWASPVIDPQKIAALAEEA